MTELTSNPFAFGTEGRIEVERILVYLLKVVSWLKVPAMLMLAVVFFLPPNFIQTNAYILSLVQKQALSQRQVNDATDVEIRSIEHRLDVLEEMRIDASIASMKATIEYDHTLLMTIAAAVLLMLLTHVLSFFRSRRPEPTVLAP